MSDPGIEFAWDEVKNRSNRAKHGLGFEQAVAVFDDPFRQMRQDRTEGGEMRWQTIGSIGAFRIVLVAHTIFDLDLDREVYRLISARRATKKEVRDYERGNG